MFTIVINEESPRWAVAFLSCPSSLSFHFQEHFPFTETRPGRSEELLMQSEAWLRAGRDLGQVRMGNLTQNTQRRTLDRFSEWEIRPDKIFTHQSHSNWSTFNLRKWSFRSFPSEDTWNDQNELTCNQPIWGTHLERPFWHLMMPEALSFPHYFDASGRRQGWPHYDIMFLGFFLCPT